MKKNLEKKIKQRKVRLRGYKEITSDEFHNLKHDEGIRLFDHYQGCKQIFYKKQ